MNFSAGREFMHARGDTPAVDFRRSIHVGMATQREGGVPDALALMRDDLDYPHPGQVMVGELPDEGFVDGHVRGGRWGHGFGLACSAGRVNGRPS